MTGLRPPPRPVFLLNHRAREGRGAARLRAVLVRAPAWASAARVVAIASLADAERAVSSLAADEVPVAAGGDGTVNLVARALRAAGDPRLALAILPLGTGNAIAHALGVGDPARALAALASRHALAIDVLATTHPAAPLALCSLSTGFEGVLLGGLAGRRGLARVGGILAAAPGALRRRSGIALAAGGETLADPCDSIFNAGLYNLPRYAFGLRVHPDSSATDGEVEAVVHARGRTWLRAVRHGLSATAERGDGVRVARATVASLSTRWPIQVDGESVRAAEIEIRIHRRAVRLVAAAAAPREPPSPG